ncbi:outer membrane protein assembly factor BamE domain-containing protein [Pseudomonas lopnurensis]|uniref:outer membrane protein assembly factor BamE domain-containing protein n=1 Tax=Pseudomonas lopnurensis TaxID=1477517 RepID=UPI00187AA573|nr:outer membrane protein assembly factor BamE [Pseudomonas lopnurensis]MBE7376269.1 outer membrane protein assembly factor BamE [Pseudomonas lopnurensis]
MSLRTPLLIAGALLLGACSPVTQENFAKLEPGMDRAQVEQLLGKPGECAGALGMSSCTWGEKNRFISVQFAGDQVMMFSGKGLK